MNWWSHHFMRAPFLVYVEISLDSGHSSVKILRDTK